MGDAEVRRLQEERKRLLAQQQSNGNNGHMDVDAAAPEHEARAAQRQFGASREILDDVPMHDHEDALGTGAQLAGSRRVADRLNEYQARGLKRQLSPERTHDPFAAAAAGSNSSGTSAYKEAMQENRLAHDEMAVRNYLAKQQQQQQQQQQQAAPAPAAAAPAAAAPPVKKKRWDQTPADVAAPAAAPALAPLTSTSSSSLSSSSSSATAASEWEAPDVGSAAAAAAASQRRSRWDVTPAAPTGPGGITLGSKWSVDATPVGGAALATPVGGQGLATPVGGQLSAMLLQQQQQQMLSRPLSEIDERNKPMTDEELDALLPSAGYTILEPPSTYVPIRTPARRLMATPTPLAGAGGYMIPTANVSRANDFGMHQPEDETLPQVKAEDYQYFAAILKEKDENAMTAEEINERKILKLLLKIKNGNPQQRKLSLRQITDKAREFGAGPLFNQILPLLMSTALEDQERHLLVKVIDRVLYKLDDLVRPYVHKILVVIEPLLIDGDAYARAEGREIISNLAKAAGLAAMIATMRPDIDNPDDFVRTTTARAFSVVAAALGIPALMPFLKAVCQSKKSWMARHTGIKIVQLIAIMMGCAVLPHLKGLVDIIAAGLDDEQQKVRTMTALAIAALAEAAHPYGIESFDNIVIPLWKGTRKYTGKGLAAFLKAIGYVIPLMEPDHASYYTREVMPTLLQQFSSADDEMKRIVLKVVKQCVATEGVEPKYIRDEVLPEFFRAFWVRKLAADRNNSTQVVETTVEVAMKAGGAVVISNIARNLKDENESFRNMTVDALEQISTKLGVSDIDERLEREILDGLLYAFNEQTSDDSNNAMLNGFGTFINTLGIRAAPYLAQISATLKWRLNHKSARVRMQAANLISKIAPVLKVCNLDDVLGILGKVLYEYLGEEYPEVLASILGALKAIVNVVGMQHMDPPIRDLLPRLTPILRNRQENVLEQVIDLVGRIADRGHESVSHKEWLRICFELLEMLKAHKKGIRKAAVSTFGYIAKAIGPKDVLSALLQNLKVQERQSRVCSVVAIAVVAETCGPFTVVPFLLADYKTPELNVQTGVLKAFSFMFEYIGQTGKDYVYPVVELLEDALIDRDPVHRQTASSVVKHMALGVAGLGCEDALGHLLNHLWPNIFETSPHVINAVTEAIEALRLALGPTVILQFVIQGLFHPARKVRQIYWKIYNNLYIGAQDSLVPAYPVLESPPGAPLDYGENDYRRHVLEAFI